MREMYSKMAESGGEMMLVVQGYILKYGDTICSHPPVVKGAMMRNPNDGKIYATRSNVTFYINKE